MSIRRTSIDRLNEARKSGRPTIAKGKPLNAQGDDGDLTFRRTSDGLKLYIKAAGKWNGVKVGESFDDLEKSLNNLQKIVSTIKKFKMPNKIVLDYDVVDAGAGKTSSSPLHIDYDRTGDVASGTDRNTALDIDLNVTGASGGTIYSTGAQIDVVGDSGGTSTARGLGIDVTGADTNEGIRLETPDGSAYIVIMSPNNNDDYCSISVGAEGATTIATVEDGGSSTAHLTLDADGDILMDAAGGDVTITSADVSIAATKKLYLDGGGDTYIYEITADSVAFRVGNDYLFTLSEYGADGNEALFKASCATFTRQEATFSTTGVIASGGSDDTDIDFRFSNKYRLEMSADIHTMNLIFPKGSGNFTLVCTTNGDHDVSYWKAFEYDESAATTADVMWAGGSVPAFTDSGVDIVSFYWDANEQQAYGVASLAFATP